MVYLGQYVESELQIASKPKTKKERPERIEARVANRLREILGEEKKYADVTPLKSKRY